MDLVRHFGNHRNVEDNGSSVSSSCVITKVLSFLVKATVSFDSIRAAHITGISSCIVLSGALMSVTSCTSWCLANSFLVDGLRAKNFVGPTWFFDRTKNVPSLFRRIQLHVVRNRLLRNQVFVWWFSSSLIFVWPIYYSLRSLVCSDSNRDNWE